MNKELLDTIASRFSPKGFHFFSENQGFTWSKIYPDRIEKIVVGYKEVNNALYLQRPSGYISFPEIDELISEINIPSNFLKHNFTCRYLNLDKIDYMQQIAGFIFTDSDDFQNWLSQNKDIMKSIFLFFSDNSNVMSVSKSLKNMQNEEAFEFLGQPFPLRKMCLLAISSPEEYTQFSQHVFDHYEKSDSPLLSATKELIKKLNKIK